MYCLPFSFSCLASSSYSLILPKRIDDVILVFTNECGKQKIKGKSHLKIEPLITKRIHLFTLFWASTKVIFIQCLLNWFEICPMDCGVEPSLGFLISCSMVVYWNISNMCIYINDMPISLERTKISVTNIMKLVFALLFSKCENCSIF